MAKNFLSILLCFLSPFCFSQWQELESNSKASLRAIQAVDALTVYASGSEGTLLKSSDGGATWKKLAIPNTEKNDFRGIAITRKGNVLAMNSGPKQAFIYRSNKKQTKWKKVYSNTSEGVFLDAINLLNEKIGFVIGDAIDSKPFLLKSNNSGKKWKRLEPSNFPDIIQGEASYAASNSCLFTQPSGQIWFNTQNRVFLSKDFGETWFVRDTPFQKGESSGIFGLYFWNPNHGIAVGGDYVKDKEKYLNFSTTTDGGVTWATMDPAIPVGLKEDATLLENGQLIMVGTSGTSLSETNSFNFRSVDDTKLHAISSYKNECWAAGPKGRIMKWSSKK